MDAYLDCAVQLSIVNHVLMLSIVFMFMLVLIASIELTFGVILDIFNNFDIFQGTWRSY